MAEINCQSCKYYKDGYCKELELKPHYPEKACDYFSRPKFGEWIPVSEGLPKEGKTVIVSTEYGVYPEARYTKEYGWEWAYEAGADYWVELANVTAWMPLPKRYEPNERSEE